MWTWGADGKDFDCLESPFGEAVGLGSAKPLERATPPLAGQVVAVRAGIAERHQDAWRRGGTPAQGARSPPSSGTTCRSHRGHGDCTVYWTDPKATLPPSRTTRSSFSWQRASRHARVGNEGSGAYDFVEDGGRVKELRPAFLYTPVWVYAAHRVGAAP
ncbi:hypothetical protein GCM10009733_049070 [Nonomuraea maheshkhaliensis]|uniref:Uncharacterized protein n=1 Tax=Nonomuraea maheshkhaliensis TaxID=419590 RepID=A0ABN2FI74_9ACTN